jgi:hypothetical protein
MTYRTHYPNQIGIVVDAGKMTWTSDPPGNNIQQSYVLYFSRGGPVGSGKRFEVFPGGRARLVK